MKRKRRALAITGWILFVGAGLCGAGLYVLTRLMVRIHGVPRQRAFVDHMLFVAACCAPVAVVGLSLIAWCRTPAGPETATDAEPIAAVEPKPEGPARLIRWLIPGAAVLLVAYIGWYWEPAAYLTLFGFGLLIPWVPSLLVVIVVRLFRRRPVIGPLLGLVLSVIVFYSKPREVVFGVPQWVQRKAQPALAALEAWKAQHGSYPPGDSNDPSFPLDLWRKTNAAGCGAWKLSAPAADSYRLLCRGTLFTICVYHSDTRTWTSFN